MLKRLVLPQDEVAAVRDKLARLRQMAGRNANDRVISAQVLPWPAAYPVAITEINCPSFRMSLAFQ
jgi:hypothetical protein